ncbi:hypothetical protein [Streptomyces sp. NPDC005336]|uniref:hypothetical protein n=1 Tax=Streptomyces sp. NPDC005336 TaxID=3157035 RepID=UPI00339E3298
MTDETTSAEETPEASPNAEAAKYRRKLRDAETQLEAANTRIETLLRRDIEQRVSDRLAVPADLFDLGKATVADLLNEDGVIMDDAIAAAVEALIEKRPGLAKPKGWGDVGGFRPSAISDPAPTWTDALRGGRH